VRGLLFVKNILYTYIIFTIFHGTRSSQFDAPISTLPRILYNSRQSSKQNSMSDRGKEIVISDDSEEEDERNNSPLDCSHEVVCAYAFD